MDTANARTLAAYEEHATEYLSAGSPHSGPNVTEWLDAVVSPYAQARILEIGSGPGRPRPAEQPELAVKRRRLI